MVTVRIDFVGASGVVYRYFARDGQRLSPSGGNFIFARDTAEGLFVVYAGEAESLAAQADERWTEAQARYGATHAFIRLNVTASVRRQELTDILKAYAPPMNAPGEASAPG